MTPNISLLHTNLDDKIIFFLDKFRKNRVPIEVSFRSLLPDLKNIDRGTHLIHTYPAKLLLHIPYFFLNSSKFSKPGDIVLDPFCGTGTVLLEALLSGRNAIGADANPLARLIAKVKIDELDENDLYLHLKIILRSDRRRRLREEPNLINLDYWFNQNIKRSLLQLFESVNEIDNDRIRDFFLVCFSNLVKKVSYADPRISVPVKLNAERYPVGSQSYEKVIKRLFELDETDVKKKFEIICKENIDRVANASKLRNDTGAKIYGKIISSDARRLTSTMEAQESLPDGSVDLIITSPPYAGAQKYIRSSSLSLGWLKMATTEEMKRLNEMNIGRESYVKADLLIEPTGISSCDDLVKKIEGVNLLRAKIVSNYINEMKAAILESVRVLKVGGYFILIVGNNKVCNFEFDTQRYLGDFIQSLGLDLQLKLIDDIKSYGLMTKRNKTADRISREWVLIFKK